MVWRRQICVSFPVILAVEHCFGGRSTCNHAWYIPNRPPHHLIARFVTIWPGLACPCVTRPCNKVTHWEAEHLKRDYGCWNCIFCSPRRHVQFLSHSLATIAATTNFTDMTPAKIGATGAVSFTGITNNGYLVWTSEKKQSSPWTFRFGVITFQVSLPLGIFQQTPVCAAYFLAREIWITTTCTWDYGSNKIFISIFDAWYLFRHFCRKHLKVLALSYTNIYFCQLDSFLWRKKILQHEWQLTVLRHSLQAAVIAQLLSLQARRVYPIWLQNYYCNSDEFRKKRISYYWTGTEK